MRIVARDRHHLGIGRVMAQGIDHDLLLGADAEIGDEPGEPGFEYEAEIEQEQGGSAALQISAQSHALSWQERCPRAGGMRSVQSADFGPIARTILRARSPALALAQAADTVARHLTTPKRRR